MQFTNLSDDPEDTGHSPAERAAAASRSTWVSVAVNLALTTDPDRRRRPLEVAGPDRRRHPLAVGPGRRLRRAVCQPPQPEGRRRGPSLRPSPLRDGRAPGAGRAAAGGRTGHAVVCVPQAGAAGDGPEGARGRALGRGRCAASPRNCCSATCSSVAKRVKSSMLVANAWHARSDAASSLVVGIGIAGNLAGYPILDPIAAAIVGFMVAKMGWEFGWDALHDLMDRAIDDAEVAAIREHPRRNAGHSRRSRHPHAQDGRHDRGRCPHRGGRRPERRSRARHRRRGAQSRDAAPPRPQPDDARRPVAAARPRSRRGRARQPEG